MHIWNDPVCLAIAALAVVSAIVSLAARPGRPPLAAGALLALASVGLAASLAHPALLPAGSMIVHADGTSGDPRVPAALLLGLAALASLVAPIRGLGLPLFGALGLALPGIVAAGLIASVASFAGLRQPAGLAGLVLGSLAIGTALQLAARLVRQGRAAWLAVAAAGAAWLVVAGSLSLHGARASMLQFPEGATADTLGQHVTFRDLRLGPDSTMTMDFTLERGGDTVRLAPTLRARRGADADARAAGQLAGGPILVPLALHELAPNPHGITWLSRGDSARAGDAVVRFRAFRMVPGDTVRFYADLDWTLGGRHGTVSPGMGATAHGETPFAAVIEGVGPVALARIDADAGRVGVVLPAGHAGGRHVAIVEMRLRPALPWAWAGAALALAGLLLGVFSPPPGAASGRG